MTGYGFPKGCIEKWDTTAKGIEEVGKKFTVVINEAVKAVQIRDLVEAKLGDTYKKGDAF